MDAGYVTQTLPKKQRKSQHDNNMIVPINPAVAAADPPSMEEINGIDMQSRMGHFGWGEVSTDVYYGIPYILRNSIKYFAVQMIIAKQPLQALFSYLNPDVYEYYYSVTEFATQAECRLLNEINAMHCDCRFGVNAFNTKSSLIKDTDAYALYEFLDTCFRKLTFCTKIISNKIGFLQFSFTSTYIPFVMQNNDLYMPLYCFSNVNDVTIDYMYGWDLAYLRFCCLYQGIWRGSSDIFPVVRLSSLNERLPTDTHYVTCWPPLHNHNLLRSALPAIGIGNQPVPKRRSQHGRDTSKKIQTPAVAAPSKLVQKRKSDAIDGEPSNKVQRRSKSTGLNRRLPSNLKEEL